MVTQEVRNRLSNSFQFQVLLSVFSQYFFGATEEEVKGYQLVKSLS